MNCKQNFVIDYLRGDPQGVKISYDFLTLGQVGIAFVSIKINAL